jgi:hypothetical protein
MKTYLADIIPKIQRFSKQLDNLTLLTNQHWVVIDGILEGKSVYIFRPNGELLISTNGEVERARWELLGQNSILVDMKHKSYLFKHGFFDENVLALKIDGREEYAFLLNENRYSGELNSVEQVVDFLSSSYLSRDAKKSLGQEEEPITVTMIQPEPTRAIELLGVSPHKIWARYSSNLGEVEFEIHENNTFPGKGDRAAKNGKVAPGGRYKISPLVHIDVSNGAVSNVITFLK